MNASNDRKQRLAALNHLLGRRLAEMRKQNSVNQAAIAEYMGFKRPLVSKIEQGDRALSAVEVYDYACALGLDDPDFLFDEIARICAEYDGSLPYLDEEGPEAR